MANPVIPELSDAEALAISDVVHAGTGIRHVGLNTDDSSTPHLFTRLKMWEKFLGDLIARYGGGCVSVGGLNVGVYALEYKIGATDKTFAGVASQALAASETSYLYLDTDQTLKIATGAWPGGDIFRVAKVTTSGSAVTAIVDARLHNFLIGIVNAWYSVPAAGDVDVNAKALKGAGQLWFNASTELTLASDVITPTQVMHSVDTQADAAADDLVTLTADAAKIGRLLILRCENAARVVTIKSTGNIKLKHGNLVLDDIEKFVLCVQITATTWIAEPMNFASFGPLLQDLDANGKRIKNVGILGLQTGNVVTVSGGAITVTHSHHYVSPEGGVGPDDLDTINGGVAGDLLILEGQTVPEVVNVTGAGNIALSAGDVALNSNTGPEGILVLRFTGSTWREIVRGPIQLSDLVGTGQVIPYQIGPCHYPGAVTVNQNSFQMPVLKAFNLRRVRGRVKTAPAGGSCIVDILKNGASIFAADANRINIAVSTLEDTSDTVNVDFAVNDYIEVKVLTANSAADLTVAFDAFTEAATAA